MMKHTRPAAKPSPPALPGRVRELREDRRIGRVFAPLVELMESDEQQFDLSKVMRKFDLDIATSLAIPEGVWGSRLLFRVRPTLLDTRLVPIPPDFGPRDYSRCRGYVHPGATPPPPDAAWAFTRQQCRALVELYNSPAFARAA